MTIESNLPGVEMPFLVAGVVLVGAIAVLNLSLTMAVIRRLRNQQATPSLPDVDSGPPVGTALPKFSADTVSGETVTAADLTGSPAVMAFFSVGCSACKPALPRLAAYATANDLTPAQVVAVIAGDDGNEHAEYLTTLEGVARIVSEPVNGPLAKSFSVTAFPSFVVVGEDGTVSRSEIGSHALATLAR